MDGYRNRRKPYEYDVIRSRRRTIAIEIDRACNIRVRAPYNAGNLMIRRFVEEKADWIERTLRKIGERRPARSDPNGTDSGRNGTSGTSPEDLISTDNLPPLSEADIRTLTDAAKEVIPGKVAFFAAQVGVTYGRITIRNQKSRWGSCSARGNLNFNCKLMQAPEEILDYVIVHELCHRREMNHSRAFWAEVEKILPDYKKRRRWLRDHGDELMHNYDI